jgi:uracil-DNA glycosylase
MHSALESSWQTILAAEFEKDYFKTLTDQVLNAYKTTMVYPPQEQLFTAFNLTPLPTVKVVILGQDPYHGPGQAEGLAFSVPTGHTLPPSLKNIYKELQSDIGRTRTDGTLYDWAAEGVLLLNSTLTVEGGRAGSHQSFSWETFTDHVISVIANKKQHVVFLLWGTQAIAKRSLIDESKHLVLTAPHPSPLSAYRGFFGCQHFSQTNAYLKATDQKPILW